MLTHAVGEEMQIRDAVSQPPLLRPTLHHWLRGQGGGNLPPLLLLPFPPLLLLLTLDSIDCFALSGMCHGDIAHVKINYQATPYRDALLALCCMRM